MHLVLLCFAGLTAILAKCGIRNTDSNVATALRTGVVLVFSWLMVFMVGAQSEIRDISAKVLIFFDFVRTVNGDILAMLFQSTADWRYQ
mgnify:FL=1